VTRAVLIGLACGLRTFAGPAVLGRPFFVAAALGEMAADKTSVVPPRTSAPALAGRMLSGALCARALAGPAAVGAAAAGAAAFAGQRARTTLAERTGLPDALLGVAEDALAVSVAALAAR
jgi:uncharacterized membrane protein